LDRFAGRLQELGFLGRVYRRDLLVEFTSRVYMLSFEVKFTGLDYKMSLPSCLWVEFIGGVYEASFWVTCYKLNLLLMFTDEVSSAVYGT